MENYREQLRETFNQSAEIYDRIRQGYPQELVNDVIGLSGIPDQGNILEIGCATGKATEPYAERGYKMDCLDIGDELAAVAIHKFRNQDHINIFLNAFEEWEPNDNKYDLVIAATSFHWLDPQVAYVKIAEVLKPGGALAAYSNTHIRLKEDFFASVQPVYRACAPSIFNKPVHPERKGDVDHAGKELFEESIKHEYLWSQEYSAEEYIQLLQTYSDHILLPDSERQALFEGIVELLNKEFGGSFVKHYKAILNLRKLKT